MTIPNMSWGLGACDTIDGFTGLTTETNFNSSESSQFETLEQFTTQIICWEGCIYNGKCSDYGKCIF